MTLEMSELEVAKGVGEFVRMDQGETVLARASPGKLRMTSESSKDD